MTACDLYIINTVNQVFQVLILIIQPLREDELLNGMIVVCYGLTSN